MASETTYTVLFPFCGLGAGALGFLEARAQVFGNAARFVSLGGIDIDPAACKDFVYLTKSPALCADIATLTPDRLREFAGERAPDVVFLSAPCTGASKLVSESKANEEKYRALNRLSEVWIDLMLETWPSDPPRLVLFENVPNLTTRAKAMLARVKKALRARGYVMHDGFHDAGELGGLAQRRRRWLMVARHAPQVPPLLYQPPKKRVRGCGEVIGPLPMPGDPAGGPMHKLPRISWLNWVRLALIPAGGDWRDLPGVLAEGQARREVFKRHEVCAWDKETGTVGGPGSNGVENVADPRVGDWFPGVLGVVPWKDPSATVTAGAAPSRGAFSVADPRVKRAYDHGYGVIAWTAPSPTVAGGSHPGQGAYSVADPRLTCAPRAGAYGVLGWEEAAKTITASANIDNGPFAIADRRIPGAPPLCIVRDPRKPPEGQAPVIVAKDGTWHRPLTTLELAVLQGMPWQVDGAPLQLAGSNVTEHRRRIGNCVPPPAARAIAERMLVNLLGASSGAFLLSGDGAVWVAPRRARGRADDQPRRRVAPRALRRAERDALLGVRA